MQASLFPVEITDLEPFNGCTARLKLVGYDSGGRQYAIKQTSDTLNGLIPINEWFGHHICRLLGIPTPKCDVVIINGKEQFGSLWEDNVTIFSPTNNNPIEITNHILEASNSINRIIPHDCFMANPDRHFGNIIFKQVRGKLTAIAFDWSEMIGIEHAFKVTNIYSHNKNTVKTKKLMYARYGLQKVFNSEVDKIALIDVSDIKKILDSAPFEWVKNIDSQGIIDFWKNDVATFAEEVKNQ